jgi:FAD/FMN-containing dehydrogenase
MLSLWNDATEDARHIDWTRWFYSAMQPWFAGSVYVNGLDQDDTGRVPEACGRNYARLREVKAVYDPGNRFRRNQNIVPQIRAPAREDSGLAGVLWPHLLQIAL